MRKKTQGMDENRKRKSGVSSTSPRIFIYHFPRDRSSDRRNVFILPVSPAVQRAHRREQSRNTSHVDNFNWTIFSHVIQSKKSVLEYGARHENKARETGRKILHLSSTALKTGLPLTSVCSCCNIAVRIKGSTENFGCTLIDLPRN